MNTSELTRAGLTLQESGVYKALLRLKKGTVSDIARVSGLHRPTIYKALGTLVEKQLLSATLRGKQKLYIAESPERLKALFEQYAQGFLNTVTELQTDFDRSSEKPQIKFVEGIEGMRSVLKDKMYHLKKGSTFYRYDAYDGTVQYQSFLPKDYSAVRDEKEWEQFVITNATLRGKEYKKRLNCASKVFPPEFDAFEYNIGQTIYGNTVIFDDFDQKTSLVIENPRFAAFQKKIFEMLYSKLG